jgi:hypothetical protein
MLPQAILPFTGLNARFNDAARKSCKMEEEMHHVMRFLVWVNVISSLLFGVAAISALVLPWLTTLSNYLWFHLFGAMLLGSVVVLTSPRFFNDWSGAFVCFLLLVCPNLWFGLVPNFLGNVVYERITYFLLMLLLVGLVVLPLSLIRATWRYNRSCLVALVAFIVAVWSTMFVIILFGQLDINPDASPREMALYITLMGSVTGLTFLLVIAIILFFASLARLLWEEFTWRSSL